MPTMDVKFKNPFYHSKVGLLGGRSDEDTIYVLDDKEVLPRTAVVLAGVSQDRAASPERGAAAQRAATEASAASIDEGEEDLDRDTPRRVRPKEGLVKGSNIPKTR